MFDLDQNTPSRSAILDALLAGTGYVDLTECSDDLEEGSDDLEEGAETRQDTPIMDLAGWL